MSEGGAVELSWYLGALDRLQLEHLVVKMIVKDDSNFDLLTEATKSLNPTTVRETFDAIAEESEDDLVIMASKLKPQLDRSDLFMKIGELQNGLALLTAVTDPYIHLCHANLDQLTDEAVEDPESAGALARQFIAELETAWSNAAQRVAARLASTGRDTLATPPAAADHEKKDGKSKKKKALRKPTASSLKSGQAVEEEDDEDGAEDLPLPRPDTLEQLFSMLAKYREMLRNTIGPIFDDALRVAKKAILKAEKAKDEAAKQEASVSSSPSSSSSSQKGAEKADKVAEKSDEVPPKKSRAG